MEHVDLPALDRKQYAIASDNHLPNFFGKLMIFRRKRKRFRDDG